MEAQNTIPKAFRVWDDKHKRWFNGKTTQEARKLQTDCVHYFGEWLLMQGTGFDQNEDNAWRDDPDVKSSIEMLNYLIVLQDIGIDDVDGNRIFEYDLVTAEDMDGILDGCICRVEYESGQYILNCENGIRVIDEDVQNIKIKCSYYENPELFK